MAKNKAAEEDIQWESYEDMMARVKKEKEQEEQKRDLNKKIRDFANGKEV